MYLLPYYSTQSPLPGTTACIHIMHLLTIGGHDLWEEDDRLRVVEDILEPNGLYLSAPIQRIQSADHSSVIIACPIDPCRTVIQDFYQWNEIPKEDHTTFCWRIFYRCGTPFFPKGDRLGPFPMKDIYEWLRAST